MPRESGSCRGRRRAEPGAANEPAHSMPESAQIRQKKVFIVPITNIASLTGSEQPPDHSLTVVARQSRAREQAESMRHTLPPTEVLGPRGKIEAGGVTK